jgi:uncharacterized membrane protein YqjE
MPDSPTSTVGSVHDEPAAWRGLSAAILKYLEARGILAKIEAQEALTQIVWAVALGMTAAILALGAWLLIVPALVWLVSHRMQWDFACTLVVTGLIHALAGGVCVWAMIKRLRGSSWFIESLDQFKKDRTWILQHSEKS